MLKRMLLAFCIRKIPYKIHYSSSSNPNTFRPQNVLKTYLKHVHDKYWKDKSELILKDLFPRILHFCIYC